MALMKQQIRDSVRRVVEHAEFRAWLAKQKLNPGDLVALNNSYVFRELGTRKSTHYLVKQSDSSGHLAEDVKVVTGLTFNSNYKHYPGHQPGLPTPIDLDLAIEDQMDQLGQVAFVLIGQVTDDMLVEQALGHGPFNKLVWNPAQSESLRVDGEVISVRDACDEERLWQELEAYCISSRLTPSEQLRDGFEGALDKLQGQAVARLRMPDGAATGTDGLTDLVVSALRSQRGIYAPALEACKGDPSVDATAYNEVLRVAYNFAHEAMTYLKLVISVCDLKPLVLWGTIGEQHALAEAFRELPFTRGATKPSLEAYVKTISDARNSAFHNIFPFQKALSVALPDAALQQPELRIFTEFRGRASSNRLNFRDKELVEVLLEFTRARSRRVNPAFWARNLAVMESTIELLEATSRVLKSIYSALAPA